NALYEDSERGVRHSIPTVLEIAKNQGLNMQNFQSCLNSPEIKAKIGKDVDESDKLNIQSTPSLFINDKALDSGSPDPQFLKALIRHLSKKV
ncbi:MAG TPA: thioredoxin domain-containing protein, partial [Leptospiraceae bacterium]|nr:thioredoxin domain-containing protein [Leptospiraceae bacterium]